VEQRTTNFKYRGGSGTQSILMLGGQSGGGANFNVVPEDAGSPSTANHPRRSRREKARLMRCWRVAVAKASHSNGRYCRRAIFRVPRRRSRSGKPWRAAYERFMGEGPRFEMVPWTAGDSLLRRAGRPAYAYGPAFLRGARADEYVDLRRITDCRRSMPHCPGRASL